jgi:hypothetical protein
MTKRFGHQCKFLIVIKEQVRVEWGTVRVERHKNKRTLRGPGRLKGAWGARPINPNEVARRISLTRKPSASSPNYFLSQPPSVGHINFNVCGIQIRPKASNEITFSISSPLPLECRERRFCGDHCVNNSSFANPIREPARRTVIQFNPCNRTRIVDTINGKRPIVCNRELLLKSLFGIVGNIWVN